MFKDNLSDIEQSGNGHIPKRPYGSTGVKLSVIGFGGIVVMNAEPEVASKAVADAIARGVNYFDVAPSYGNAEEKLGPALQPYRKDVFLACKTGERDKKGAQVEFEQSLKNLRTDYFDLYQLHGIVDVKKDVDAAFAKGGVMEMIMEEKKQGRIRYVGFSAHTHAAALTAMDRYDFDSVLFPINFATFYKNKFGQEVIARAKEKSLAILALKSMACQRWPADDPLKEKYSKCWYQPLTDPDDVRLAMSFTLAQNTTALIPPGEEELFRLALDTIADYKPLTDDENKKLIAMASQLDPIFPE
ncbi:MAG: aldo/keto reductase [Planctomycetes bacterium]|nr:aldo/keto reductase [Planctomycetota bacterium]